MVPMTAHEAAQLPETQEAYRLINEDEETDMGVNYLTALADQMSGLVALCAETNASVKRTEATVAGLADVLKSFAEVNPQELMGLLGGIIGK
jgi:hypothetical protein